MSESKREKLKSLGADPLADLLLEATRDSEAVGNKVQRATSDQTQNSIRFARSSPMERHS